MKRVFIKDYNCNALMAALTSSPPARIFFAKTDEKLSRSCYLTDIANG